MKNDSILIINTCRSMQSSEHASEFLGIVEKLFETNEYEIVWADPGTRRAQRIPRRECSDDLIAARWASGDLAVECGRDAEWSAGMSWRRYQRSQVRTSGVPEGFMPNQMQIVLPESRLRTAAFTERVAESFRLAAIYLQADYGVVRPRLRAEARYRSVFGYAAGIEDIFWLNYFGPPYTRMFALDEQHRLSAFFVDKPADDSLLIRLTPNYFDPSLTQHACDVRAQLGEATFLKPTEVDNRKTNYSSGSLLNPYRLFSFLWGVADNSAARREAELIADVRPVFDFSEMIDG